MNINGVLIVGGLSLSLLGIYRVAPLKIEKSFLLQTVPVFVMLAMMVIGILLKAGKIGLATATTRSVETAAKIGPMLIGIVAVMAFASTLAGYFKSELTELISGKWGVGGVVLASFITPTSSAFGKFISDAWSNPTLRPQLMLFLVISPMLSWNLFFLRQIGITFEIARMMYIYEFFIALICIPALKIIERFVPL
jgi:hypothetical protein